MVLLNVYDVSDGAFERINKVFTAGNNVLVGGVFHAGVEIYQKEWCYGVTEYGRSGVAAVYPRSHPQHTYRCTVPIGETPLNEEEVLQLCRRLSEEWPGHEYDLIHHNCLSFCNAALKELVEGGRIPGWVDRAARAGANIDIFSKKVAQDTHETVQRVRSMTSDLKEKAGSLATEDLPAQAAENLEVLRRESAKAIDAAREESAKALELARQESEKLAEKASEHMTVLGTTLGTSKLGSSLWEWGEGLRSSAQKGLEEQAPEVVEQAEVLRRKSQELTGEVGEKAQALGASLWQWGQNIQSTLGLEEATANLHASVSAYGTAVSSLVEGDDGAGYAQSSSLPQAPRLATKGLLDEDGDSLLGGDARPAQDLLDIEDDLLLDSDARNEERSNLGLIRTHEENVLKQGLLVEEEEDNDDLLDLRDIAKSIKEHEGSRKALPIVEVSEDWLSSAPTIAAEVSPTREVVVDPPSVDPLDSLDWISSAPVEKSQDVAPGKGPMVAKDPLDLMG
jgi:hypothetical protein